MLNYQRVNPIVIPLFTIVNHRKSPFIVIVVKLPCSYGFPWGRGDDHPSDGRRSWIGGESPGRSGAAEIGANHGETGRPCHKNAVQRWLVWGMS